MTPDAESFASEIDVVLPPDLPNRESVVRLSARHLELVAEANRHFNLTRIVSPRQAAIKHVLDSVAPWGLFAGASRAIDAGSGAGFPGVPLALALPETCFTLAESIGKKARFLKSAVRDLAIPNVSVEARRAEELWRVDQYDVIMMRAVAPVDRAIDLADAALRVGARLLLYRGPEAEEEIKAAMAPRKSIRPRARIVLRYDLPEGMGSRSVVEITY